jgi:hypothetical protein
MEGVAGSQPVSTAVHRSPNKLWRYLTPNLTYVAAIVFLLTQIYRSACNTDNQSTVDGGQSTGEKRTLGISNGNTIETKSNEKANLFVTGKIYFKTK